MTIRRAGQEHLGVRFRLRLAFINVPIKIGDGVGKGDAVYGGRMPNEPAVIDFEVFLGGEARP